MVNDGNIPVDLRLLQLDKDDTLPTLMVVEDDVVTFCVELDLDTVDRLYEGLQKYTTIDKTGRGRLNHPQLVGLKALFNLGFRFVTLDPFDHEMLAHRYKPEGINHEEDKWARSGIGAATLILNNDHDLFDLLEESTPLDIRKELEQAHVKIETYEYGEYIQEAFSA